MQLILILWVLNELFEVQVGLEALLMLQCFNISAATVFFCCVRIAGAGVRTKRARMPQKWESKFTVYSTNY